MWITLNHHYQGYLLLGLRLQIHDRQPLLQTGGVRFGRHRGCNELCHFSRHRNEILCRGNNLFNLPYLVTHCTVSSVCLITIKSAFNRVWTCYATVVLILFFPFVSILSDCNQGSDIIKYKPKQTIVIIETEELHDTWIPSFSFFYYKPHLLNVITPNCRMWRSMISVINDFCKLLVKHRKAANHKNVLLLLLLLHKEHYQV